jgi:hypothetical protein
MPDVFEKMCVCVEALINSNELSNQQLSSSRGSGFWMKSLNMSNKRSMEDECETTSEERSEGCHCSS